MCGIAGYSVNPESGLDRTLSAQALLAGIAERGAEALEHLDGAMATAWLDEERPELILARGTGRPLWVALGRGAAFFASTSSALELLERSLRLALRKVELPAGTIMALDEGEVVAR